MAKKTFKDILNEALSKSAHIKKSAFVASNDVDDQQMVAIANDVVDFINDWYSWGELRKIFSITMQSGQTRYATPADFNALVPDSMREQDGTRKVEVNVPDRRWFQYKFGTLNTGPIYRVRLYGDEVEFAEIDIGQTVEMEYYSNHLVKDDTGVTKEFFDSDTDTFVLNDRMLILGIQAFWAETKELPQADRWMARFIKRLNTEVGRTTQGETIGGHREREVIGNSPYTRTYIT